MTTTIRPTISKKNKYWISKHRYYELKHFCLQYKTWKKAYSVIENLKSPELRADWTTSNSIDDPTSRSAIIKAGYSNKIDMIEKSAFEADSTIAEYIIKAVTEELSYNYLKSKLNIPCSRDTYYDRYRKFFWILSKKRD